MFPDEEMTELCVCVCVCVQGMRDRALREHLQESKAGAMSSNRLLLSRI